jgi:CPA2 family monovalent cation:H+ antiporter-2
MGALKNILAATDLSSSSSLAIDRGFVVAKATGARYTVIHAVGMDALAPLRGLLGEDADAVSQKIMDEARKRLAEVVADSPVKGDVQAHLQVERGLAASAIPVWSEAAGIDLVLMGSHGSGFLRRTVLGSTVSRLLRKSKCPVLVVKQEAHRNYRRVLVAADFSPASQAAVQLARAVAPGADIVLLNVFDVPFEGKLEYAGVSDEVIREFRVQARTLATQQLRELAESVGLSTVDYSGLVMHGYAARNILEQEDKLRCDLIVLGKHGTHVTEELLLGSVTKSVLADSRSDVLVVVDKRLPEAHRFSP